MLNIPRLDPPLLLLEKVPGLEKDLSVDNYTWDYLDFADYLS